MPARADEWPPSDDVRVWAWMFAAYVPSIVAWLLGVPFWVHGPGAGPFRATNPLTWTSVLPLLGLALYVRRAPPFQVALWIQLVVGALLMLTLLEAPRALLSVGVVGSGLGRAGYVDVMLAYALAFAAGALSLGFGAYLLRRKASVDAARARSARAT